jgi:UDP-N-acetyl-D-galactosamine dehydrogenase
VVRGCIVSILGLTFKEDCPDLRNSRVVDIVRELQDYGVDVQVSDPLAGPVEAVHEYGVHITPLQDLKPAAALIVAVAHKLYREMKVEQLQKLLGPNPTLIDVKCLYPRHEVERAGIRLWRL